LRGSVLQPLDYDSLRQMSFRELGEKYLHLRPKPPQSPPTTSNPMDNPPQAPPTPPQGFPHLPSNSMSRSCLAVVCVRILALPLGAACAFSADARCPFSSFLDDHALELLFFLHSLYPLGYFRPALQMSYLHLTRSAVSSFFQRRSSRDPTVSPS